MKRFMPVVSWIILTPLGGVYGQSADIGCVGLIDCSGCDVICDPLFGERSLSQCFVLFCFTGLGSTHYREVRNLESKKVCWSNRACPLHSSQFKFRSSAESKFVTWSQWLWSLSVHMIPWEFCGFLFNLKNQGLYPQGWFSLTRARVCGLGTCIYKRPWKTHICHTLRACRTYEDGHLSGSTPFPFMSRETLFIVLSCHLPFLPVPASHG